MKKVEKTLLDKRLSFRVPEWVVKYLDGMIAKQYCFRGVNSRNDAFLKVIMEHAEFMKLYDKLLQENVIQPGQFLSLTVKTKIPARL